ncbi:Hsp33 family molecular chaperone HslO [Uliginosibacterium flavum]|uniref:Hsp33 family molecular chaperone HslO n=1 Tax=Uliginosibacterium flavum TaxID=1396831 RepID=A0ABV2TIJ0_9RHOO
MHNTVTRFLLENLDIRGAIVQLDSVWQAISARRKDPATVTAVLGEMCAVSAIIGANLKQAARLTFQLTGQGPVSLLVIDCSESLNLRGYARHTLEEASTAPLSSLFADGQMLMSLEMPEARQPYQSHVPVEGESIAEIFQHYLSQSEQQPASLFLAANGEHAVGLFLQKLPGADLKDADGWNRAAHLASTIKREELFELDAFEVLDRLFGEETVRVYEPRIVSHDFPPDRDKIATMLRGLGSAEIEHILAEHGEVLINDELSNHEYHFSVEEARALFGPEGPTVH